MNAAPTLHRIHKFLCNKHFKQEQRRQEENFVDLDILSAHAVIGIAQKSWPMFVNHEVTPLVGTTLPSHHPSNQPSSITTPPTPLTSSIIDNTWFIPLTSLKYIIKHGNVPEGTPGQKKY